MQFKQGAKVVTVTNEQVGHVDRVVIDPRTKDITDIVVRQGILFTEDKVIPMDLLSTATEDRIVLKDSIRALEELQPFEEAHYIPVEEKDSLHSTDSARPLYVYPPVGVAWRGGYPTYPYLVEVERNIPAGTVPLREGARVISEDDEDLGAVERVFTEAQSDQVTHIVISQGVFLKDRKLIPAGWLLSLGENVVHLAVTASLVRALPEYKLTV